MSNAELKTTEKVRIDGTEKGFAVIAAQPLAVDEPVFPCEGVQIPAPNRYSVCVDGKHIDPQTPARFLNHSCAPNCRFEGRWLVACVDIPAGTELTFDYAQTESVIAAPFDCQCGAPGCRGRISS